MHGRVLLCIAHDPRGLTAATLTPPDRLLAAADAYQDGRRPKPHEIPAYPPASRRGFPPTLIAVLLTK